ncbi:MAG: putative Ca-activated chloride channel family protein, partial [Streblomastix strix]
MKDRQPLAIALVIDKSGSTAEKNKIDYAKLAAKSLLWKLYSLDKLAIVTFDFKVAVLLPLTSFGNKKRIESLIDQIQPDGGTFLSGGLEEGINQIEKASFEGTKKVILLSVGLANIGVQDIEGVSNIAASYRSNGISVSTVGLELEYSEELMLDVSQRGGRLYYYVGGALDLPKVFDTELSMTNDAVAHHVSVTIKPNQCVKDVKVYGLSSKQVGNETIAHISDLVSEEERQFMFRLTVDPSAFNKENHWTEDQDQSSEAVKLDLGEVHIQFRRTDSSQPEKIIIPLSVLVDDNEERSEEVNGDEEITASIPGQIRSGNRNHIQSIVRVAEIIISSQTDKAKTNAIKKIKQHDESLVETILNVHRKHLLQIQQVITIPKDKIIQIQQQSDVGMNSSSAVSLRTRYIVDALALYMSTRILKDDVSHEDMKDGTSNENKPSRIQLIPLDQQQSPVQIA